MKRFVAVVLLFFFTPLASIACTYLSTDDFQGTTKNCNDVDKERKIQQEKDEVERMKREQERMKQQLDQLKQEQERMRQR
jgi:cell division protein FtsB